jgi:hypothetical protein
MQIQTVKLSGAKKYPVRSVMMVQRAADGSITRTQLSEKKGKRRVSKRWRPFEKALRRLNNAHQTAASVYRDRHERSNVKKKNGALRDLVKNVIRAQRKGTKKLKLRFL